MDISGIYSGIMENISKIEPEVCELESEVKRLEILVEESMTALDKAEEKLKSMNTEYNALLKAKENLELIYIPPKNENKSEEDKYLVKPVKQIKYTRKFGTLYQYDRNGEIIKKYGSQKAAARSIGWDQSSISRFMKFAKDEQIRKKGFYFEWGP